MAKKRVKKRRTLLIAVTIVVLLFDIALLGLKYYDDTVLAKQIAQAHDKARAIEAELKKVKEKKAAEKRQSEAAEAALKAQQDGEVVSPEGCTAKGPHSDPNKIDVVINKKRCFNPIDFAPDDLVTLYGVVLSTKLQADLVAMMNAAQAAGLPLGITSGYRSYANQVATYNNWVRANGSTAAADTVSARPGYSEHQTGLAMDFAAGNCSLECFKTTAHYAWMHENAANYGFVERYPVGHEKITGYSPEAWHWRYVGRTVAMEMKQLDVKTLEQLWGLQGGSY